MLVCSVSSVHHEAGPCDPSSRIRQKKRHGGSHVLNAADTQRVHFLHLGELLRGQLDFQLPGHVRAEVTG